VDTSLIPQIDMDLYLGKIGKQFSDTEEDGKPVFEVIEIVRREEDHCLYFAYKPIDIFAITQSSNVSGTKEEDDECVYTECNELMNAAWAGWL
jgi:hypothetical protein